MIGNPDTATDECSVALKPLKDLKCKLEFESVVSALSTATPLPLETDTTDNCPKVDIDSGSNLEAHGTPETVYNSESNNEMLMIYPPTQSLGEKENEGIDNTEIADIAQEETHRGKGIFDRGIESSVEMEWSSDESTPITSGKTAGKTASIARQAAADSLNPVTLLTQAESSWQTQSAFNRKGAWSEEESQCLLEGVEKFGEGKWKEIRTESYSVLKYRTTSQLKDKYRNIKGRQKHY